jgi:hypothetical protein
VCRKDVLWRFRENFWGNCFGKNLVKLIIAGVEIFANRISQKVKPSDEVRELGIVSDGLHSGRSRRDEPEIAGGDIGIQSIPHSDKESPQFLYVLPK